MGSASFCNLQANRGGVDVSPMKRRCLYTLFKADGLTEIDGRSYYKSSNMLKINSLYAYLNYIFAPTIAVKYRLCDERSAKESEVTKLLVFLSSSAFSKGRIYEKKQRRPRMIYEGLNKFYS